MSAPSRSPSPSRRTNTLAITPLPRYFFEPLVLDVLRQHFESYGEIAHWVPLKSFHRILVVYRFDDDAERAKLSSDPIILEHPHESQPIKLRVYRADPTPVTEDPDEIVEGRFLCPPTTDKNFLISPPGSPPVGWESVREDPPNATPLADDLILALAKLRTTQDLREQKVGSEILLAPEEAGVGVYVENVDGGIEVAMDEEWHYGDRSPVRTNMWKPVATSMPPIRAAVP